MLQEGVASDVALWFEGYGVWAMVDIVGKGGRAASLGAVRRLRKVAPARRGATRLGGGCGLLSHGVHVL